MKLTRYLIAAVGLILFTSLVALADSYPARKAGLWQIETSLAEMGSAQVMKQCIDATTDQKLLVQGKKFGQDICSKNEMRKEGQKFVHESVCNYAGHEINTQLTLEGDFTSSYTGNSVSKFTPPLAGKETSSFTLSAKWLGECAPGQEPGDTIMENGMVIKLKG